jgi:hypothetical protein
MQGRWSPSATTPEVLCLLSVPTPLDPSDKVSIQMFAVLGGELDTPFAFDLIEYGLGHQARPANPIVRYMPSGNRGLEIACLIGRRNQHRTD